MRSPKFKQNLNTNPMSFTGTTGIISRGAKKTIFDMPDPEERSRLNPNHIRQPNSSNSRYRDNPRVQQY